MRHLQLPDGSTPYAALDGSGATLADVDAGDVIQLFTTHGALLLRNFNYDLAGFRAFSGQFCSRFVRNESGKRDQVSADGTTQSVNLGREAFPLHPELSRVPWRPDIAWFACARPPASRGETLVCDGVATAAGLDADTRAYLATRSVLYREETPPGAFTEWLGIPPPDDTTLAALSAHSPFLFQRAEGRIFRSFTAPFLHRPLFTDQPAFGNFLLFARRMLHTRQFPLYEDGSLIEDEICDQIARVSDKLTAAHRWQAGDILMLDNSRFMHGRNPVDDPDNRVIWTQFGYASFLRADDPRREQLWRHTDDARAIFFGLTAKRTATAH
ncbi:MAG: TauD/TfdA family dioxygenase [Gammaproteobacteria bacterium]